MKPPRNVTRRGGCSRVGAFSAIAAISGGIVAASSSTISAPIMPDASWRAEEPSQCGWYQYVPAKAEHGAWDTPRSYTARGIAAAAALTDSGRFPRRRTARVRQRDLVFVRRRLAGPHPGKAREGAWFDAPCSGANGTERPKWEGLSGKA